MKKLDVSKIVVLTAISVSLIACGATTESSPATNQQDSNSLKVTNPRDEGGGQRSAPSDVAVDVDEGGGQKIAPTDIDTDVDEGGGQLAAPAVNEVDEGGGQLTSPGDTTSELEEGGGQLTVILTEHILTIKGVTERDDSRVVLVINGTNKFEIKVSDLGFYTQIELSKEDLSKMIFDVVVDGKVTTYMIYDGVLKEYTFR